MAAIESTVKKILGDVKKNGDAALFRYTKKFDGHALSRTGVEVSKEERRAAWRQVGTKEIATLKKIAARIRKFHQRELQNSWVKSEGGLQAGLRWSPLTRVGVYVPGGRAAYPSTVLMNVIPAVIAGVPEIVMVTPFPNGQVNPLTLAAATIAGVSRIFKIGGAQAIAALAFGTRSVPKVDKIVGPGNRFVTEAKRQLFGQVGMDGLAGPTELVVIADDAANPAWIAMDLIAQAEHDPDARPIVISPSSRLLKRVAKEVEDRVGKIERKRIATAAFWRHGEKIHVKNLTEACVRVNKIAPEHLSLQVRNPRRLLQGIFHAGAIFLGPYSAVAAGDYAVGSNHVLPTAGTARFASPLGVYDFQKATSIIEVTPVGLRRLAPLIETLAQSEGLTAHAESVAVRLTHPAQK